MPIPSVSPELIDSALAKFDQEERANPKWQNWETRESYKYATWGAPMASTAQLLRIVGNRRNAVQYEINRSVTSYIALREATILQCM